MISDNGLAIVDSVIRTDHHHVELEAALQQLVLDLSSDRWKESVYAPQIENI